MEAISPTLPTEDSSQRQYKEELLQSITKKDAEIQTIKNQIENLKKKEQQLKDKKSSDEKPDSPELPTSETKNQSLAQIIYAENRVNLSFIH